MKFRILISILFVFTTVLSAMHELEHIMQDDASCIICHINDNPTPLDKIHQEKNIELFHFENIIQNNQVLNSYVENISNPNRAPPKLS